MRAVSKGPGAVGKRYVRKSIYRKQGTWTRAILKSFGL